MSSAQEVQWQLNALYAAKLAPAEEAFKMAINSIIKDMYNLMAKHEQDYEIQLQRMTDDGCPL